MNSILNLPPMTPGDAASIGFATLYQVPHLPIDVPDGGFTLTLKTSNARRVTLYFGPLQTGGPPETLHIQYHDRGSNFDAGDGSPQPTFDIRTLGQGQGSTIDTHDFPAEQKPARLIINLDQINSPDVPSERGGGRGE